MGESLRELAGRLAVQWNELYIFFTLHSYCKGNKQGCFNLWVSWKILICIYSIVLHKQPCFHGSRGQTGEETGNKIATQGGFIWNLWITSCDLFDSLVLLLKNISQYGLLNERCLIVKCTPVILIRSWKQWMDSWILCKITLSSVQISVVHIPSC